VLIFSIGFVCTGFGLCYLFGLIQVSGFGLRSGAKPCINYIVCIFIYILHQFEKLMKSISILFSFGKKGKDTLLVETGIGGKGKGLLLVETCYASNRSSNYLIDIRK
jgi:hypothetical protein